MLGCVGAPPPSYVETAGDCDDYRKTTFPGAKELCNTWDDDCDGQVDEDAVPVELWPDADGDGYYGRAEQVGEAKVGCAGLKGYAAEGGDCQPMNAAVNPGAEEVCNNQDDDCDGEADERVRPTCGEGWCRRESLGCDVAFCLPGQPTAELCNFLDDDCDGEVDEEPNLCGAGKTCAAGTCVDSSEVSPTPGAGATSGAGNSSGGPGSAGNSSGAGGTAAPASEESGCALGHRSSHGALAVLLLSAAASALRRRRKLS
jgi:Putative metal-binding motif